MCQGHTLPQEGPPASAGCVCWGAPHASWLLGSQYHTYHPYKVGLLSKRFDSKVRSLGWTLLRNLRVYPHLFGKELPHNTGLLKSPPRLYHFAAIHGASTCGILELPQLDKFGVGEVIISCLFEQTHLVVLPCPQVLQRRHAAVW